MMMPETDYILAPQVVDVTFRLEPTSNLLESLMLLNETDRLSGLSDWTVRTSAALSSELLERNMLVVHIFDLMFYGVLSSIKVEPDNFPAYISAFERYDPTWIRDEYLKKLVEIPLH